MSYSLSVTHSFFAKNIFDKLLLKRAGTQGEQFCVITHAKSSPVFSPKLLAQRAGGSYERQYIDGYQYIYKDAYGGLKKMLTGTEKDFSCINIKYIILYKLVK